MYVDDAVLALIMLVKRGGNQVYNIGSGKEISLNEVFAGIKGLLGAKAKPIYRPAIVLETPRSALDIKKIKKELGYDPKTSMKEGLLKTIEYYKNAKS